MTTPLQVTFHNMQPKPALEQEIRSRMAWLETFHPGLISGKVLIDVPHRHRRGGRQLRVNISLSMPGGEVVVDHQAADSAIHDAFDVARRRVEDFVRRQRGD